MKTDTYQKRFYRDWVYPRRLFKTEVIVKETDLQISTDKPLDTDRVIRSIRRYRDAIEEYINYTDRRFLTSLKPIPVEAHCPRIIADMASASQKANVGPMAAVAGALAQHVGRLLVRAGYRDVIVENGGDIFLKISRPIAVGIFAGRKRLLGRLSLAIRPSQTPLGICTSSGTIGHSLSFGCADSVVVIARSACLADAVATATANRVRTKKDLDQAIGFARSIAGIRGAVIILKNTLASWGAVEFT